ncbi:MAG: pili assembly chaperone [Acidobacteria bacterium]|nr:MAG: pili assembly chaperone [Acidobacteriota bacterium]
MRKRQRGFSSAELVVIVAILLVIAAIAIPNLLHSKLSENESSAVGSLGTLNSSCASYLMLYGGYPKSLSNLGPGNPAHSASADLIDSALVSGTKSGYAFTYTPGATGVRGNVLSYSITANPTSPGITGRRGFFTDQSGVIRANTTGAADAGSTPIG